jgi:hypothetical protein
VQTREPFRALAAELDVSPARVEGRGDTAAATVEVRPRTGPPFEQRFALARARPEGPWLIVGVEQRGVVDGNRAAAFVAHPSEATRLRLEATLRRAGGAPPPPPR